MQSFEEKQFDEEDYVATMRCSSMLRCRCWPRSAALAGPWLVASCTHSTPAQVGQPHHRLQRIQQRERRHHPH